MALGTGGIEKERGVQASHDVKRMGIAEYNERCRGIVMRYAKEWERIVTRCGRWIVCVNDCKTMSVLESVCWVFKALWDKGQVYRGFKVMSYSWRCTTTLSHYQEGVSVPRIQGHAVLVVVHNPAVSHFPANLNYQEVRDPAIVVTLQRS